ncbi:MAG: CoA transferase [Alphaproteobacteria bacterium]|nr:CoA transferase [Alphaproteobacteria bacterium]
MTATDPTDKPKGPLAGLLVIDLTRVLAGPYCTLVLQDLGATVIKVETPQGGDDARHYGPFVNGKSAYFMSLNRGKRSIALDLKAPADRAVFERMIGRADIVVENYRPGTMEKLGYGWQALRTLNKRLIYAAVSGFGQTGPYKNRAAYDMVVQAMGGVMSLTGHDDGKPTRVGTSIGDITAGLFGTIGILSALEHRHRSGEGTMVDVAMLDCQIAILENAIARYAATGQVPGPMGARHPSITPFEALKAADGHMVIAAGNDQLFARLADALGKPALAKDERFKTNDARTRNHGSLKAELEGLLAARPSTAWLAILDKAGVPCGPINNVAEALADPQIVARGMVVTTDDPVAGTLKMAGNPIKLSGFADPATRGPTPELDGDRAAILKELGL